MKYACLFDFVDGRVEFGNAGRSVNMAPVLTSYELIMATILNHAPLNPATKIGKVTKTASHPRWHVLVSIPAVRIIRVRQRELQTVILAGLCGTGSHNL